MTTQQINEQIIALKEVTKEYATSKESAKKFLIDAGIIKGPKKRNNTVKHN